MDVVPTPAPAQALDLDAILHTAATCAMQLTGADGAIIEWADRDEVVYRAAAGTAEPFLGLRLKVGTSLSGVALLQRTVIECTDSETDPRVDREACRKVGARSMIIAPVLQNNVAIGVIKVLSRQPRFFGSGPEASLDPSTPSRSTSSKPSTMLESIAAMIGAQITYAVGERTASPLLIALQESEELFRAFMTHGPYAAWMKDRGGRYTFTNAAFTSAFGAAGAPKGKTAEELFQGRGHEAATEDAKVLEGEQVRSTHVMPIGGADKTFLAVRFPILTRGERSVGGVAIEITAQVEAEERQRRSREELWALIEKLPDAVAVLKEGALAFVNPAFVRAAGRRQEDLLGHRLTDFVHEEDRAHLDALLASPIEAPDTDVRFVGVNGIATLHVTAMQSIQFERGTATLVAAQDVTVERQLRTRLALADRMASVGTLAAGIAHEINTPLAYVMSNLELLAEELSIVGGGSPSSRWRSMADLVTEARQGTERVRKIVRGLKTFSRADEETPTSVALPAVLELSINMALNEIRHRANVVKDLGPTPRVRGDESRLAQVFINLLINAAHAIPEGNANAHEIRVTTMTVDGGAVVEVRDTGHGIAKADLSRIYDPFFTTKPVGVGTGLGLSICHNIITGLGGTIAVESVVDRGTCVRVSLPAEVSADDIAARRSPAATIPAPDRHSRVLIVDDDPSIGRSLARALRDHDVTTCTSAAEALARVQRGEHYDVIFSDLMMPEMTGMELHARLLELDPRVAERMVFLTGGAFTPNARKFLDEVPNERYDKPFDLKDIRAVARRLAARE